MVRPEVIRRRLQKLDGYLDDLNEAEGHSFEKIRTDIKVYSAVERNL